MKEWLPEPTKSPTGKVAHILPHKIRSAANMLLGSSSPSDDVVWDTRNGMFMQANVEKAFDNRQIVIVPADNSSTDLKLIVVDPKLLHQSRKNFGSNYDWTKLDGTKLEFHNSNRPGLRYLYFHYVVVLLSTLDQQPGEDRDRRLEALEPKDSIWATEGSYIQKGQLGKLHNIAYARWENAKHSTETEGLSYEQRKLDQHCVNIGRLDRDRLTESDQESLRKGVLVGGSYIDGSVHNTFNKTSITDKIPETLKTRSELSLRSLLAFETGTISQSCSDSEEAQHTSRIQSKCIHRSTVQILTCLIGGEVLQSDLESIVDQVFQVLRDTEVHNKDRWTPMHVAAWHGHKETVAKLQQLGHKVDVADNDRWTPMHVAAWHGHNETVDYLKRFVTRN